MLKTLFNLIIIFLASFLTYTGSTFAQTDNAFLHAGEKIEITVWNEADLSGIYQIDQNGFINMPLIGALNLSNLNLTSAENLIASRLANGYLIQPHVSIHPLYELRFYILGDINYPGYYTSNTPINMLKAVALAGGYKKSNASATYYVVHKNSNDKLLSHEFETVMDGDTLIIKDRSFW